MAKKLFAQLALGIMIGVITAPVVFAEGAAAKLGDVTQIYSDVKPCINEVLPNTTDPTNPKDGPDNGYVISIIEEPLNVDASGEGTDYVIRRCFRNTFQYMETTPIADGKDADGKTKKKDTLVPKSASMLSDKCSNKAQGLMKKYKDDKDIQAAYSCKEVQAILTRGGTSAIYGYINMLYRWGASLVGIIAVTIIIISGIQISASGGDSEAINSAKKRILQSVVGIIVLFLASLILYTANPTFFTR